MANRGVEPISQCCGAKFEFIGSGALNPGLDPGYWRCSECGFRSEVKQPFARVGRFTGDDYYLYKDNQKPNWRDRASQTIVRSCPTPHNGVEIVESGEYQGFEPLTASPVGYLDYLFYAGPTPKGRVQIHRHRFSSTDSQSERQAVTARLVDEGFVLLAVVHVSPGSTSIVQQDITDLSKEAA